MRDTLVLNASFEPLSTVTLNRAVVLILTDKAVVEQSHPEPACVVPPWTFRCPGSSGSAGTYGCRSEDRRRGPEGAC